MLKNFVSLAHGDAKQIQDTVEHFICDMRMKTMTLPQTIAIHRFEESGGKAVKTHICKGTGHTPSIAEPRSPQTRVLQNRAPLWL